MERMHVLVANEPRTYREAIADTLRQLRPHIEVNAVEPDGLETEIGRFRPHLVVCSRAFAAVQVGLLAWVTLYPDGENRAEIATSGKLVTIANVGFGDLLAILDETELLCRSA
jgi:hypothetical protein